MRKKQNIPPPEGFRYQADVLPSEEEQDLVERIRALPLKERVAPRGSVTH
jgi:hypothetical protein